MRVYIAGIESMIKGKYKLEIPKNTKILTSFYHCNDECIELLINTVGRENILVDSGAFTYRVSFKNKYNTTFDSNLEQYIKNYIDFINKHDIKYFFEIDVDTNKEEYKQVKQIRNRIEKETGKQSIPVFHDSRGIDDWFYLCDNYKYIAIGGLVESRKDNYIQKLTTLVKYATLHNTKVHGLGYTTKNSKSIGFYSVDSTSWNGSKFGNIFKYNFDKLPPTPIDKQKDKRLITAKLPYINQSNFNEWYKYQQDLLKEEYLYEKGLIV